MPLAQDEFDGLAVAELAMVNRLARRLCRDAARAEDLVQETYLRALRFRGTFELREFGIRPWLARILHGVYFNHLRSEGRQPVAIDDERMEIGGSETEPTGPGDPYGFETMDQRLVAAIESLKPPHRQVLLLWAVHELNYSEIAEKLHVPIGTVMSRLHRARQQLKARLEGAFPHKTAALQRPA
jgi:RNA polymerase sigma-70 factor (ECF subfamily)